MMNNFIEFDDYIVGFCREAGGFPEKITLKLRGGKKQDIVKVKAPWLEITLPDGKKALPYLTESYEPKIHKTQDKVLADFWNIPWRTFDGDILNQWFLNLSYEFNSDGVCFMRMFFTALALDLPDIHGFSIKVPMSLGDSKDVTYGYWKRPTEVSSNTIQATKSFVRNITERKNVKLDNMIIPLVGFDYGENGNLSRHIEWMMEGQNSLGTDFSNTHSSIAWQNDDPIVEWEFAHNPVSANERPYQWRNQMGFVLGQTPKIRAKAPLRLYHHLDLYQRFPTTKQIGKMALEGANALILHEGWRTDMQNGGVPYDEAAFKEVVEACHKHDIRLMVYIRGNEPSVREDMARWFSTILKKDYDGLYADYGGPVHFYHKDENSPGGRFAFKEHYYTMKNLREHTIGKEGLFLLHTGPFFSGSVLCSIVDGYTSGEGEKGVMLQSRRENLYFSEAAIAPGALWTAAFPDYKTKKMLPYMANIGQYPHVSLGVQLRSSSLAHPSEPGNITFIRPLWKLYELMDGEKNIRFSNDVCFPEAVKCDSQQTGAAVYAMEDGSCLIIVSNFRNNEAKCDVLIDYNALGIETTNKSSLMLNVNNERCNAETISTEDAFSATLQPYGIIGYLIYDNGSKWDLRIEKYLKAYAKPDVEEVEYVKSIEIMRRNRFEPLRSKELYLKVKIPTISLNWEDEVWWDLYNSVYEMYVTPEKGNKTFLGYIGKNGFTKVLPEGADILWPGKETPVISLPELLPRGRSRVELKAVHLGEPFYSFAEAVISSDMDGRLNTRELAYMSELDSDRSRLTFDVDIA